VEEDSQVKLISHIKKNRLGLENISNEELYARNVFQLIINFPCH